MILIICFFCYTIHCTGASIVSSLLLFLKGVRYNYRHNLPQSAYISSKNICLSCYRKWAWYATFQGGNAETGDAGQNGPWGAFTLKCYGFIQPILRIMHSVRNTFSCLSESSQEKYLDFQLHRHKSKQPGEYHKYLNKKTCIWESPQ